MRVAGLLVKKGIDAKLVQLSDDFNLYNLCEVRYFLKALSDESGSMLDGRISDDVWKRAKNRLESKYFASACMENIRNMLAEFESASIHGKYLSDFECFAKESKFDDFGKNDVGTVFVSTVHKAKGREFKTVFMMVSGNRNLDDAEVRRLYVGMTRAKDNLYIHCNSSVFDGCVAASMCLTDKNHYPETDGIIMRLGYKDVNLGYFKFKKSLILGLRSGARLFPVGDGSDGLSVAVVRNAPSGEIMFGNHHVLKFSKRFVNDVLMPLFRKGYRIKDAKVDFIVAWKDKDAPEEEDETAVLLPELDLGRL